MHSGGKWCSVSQPSFLLHALHKATSVELVEWATQQAAAATFFHIHDKAGAHQSKENCNFAEELVLPIGIHALKSVGNVFILLGIAGFRNLRHQHLAGDHILDKTASEVGHLITPTSLVDTQQALFDTSPGIWVFMFKTFGKIRFHKLLTRFVVLLRRFTNCCLRDKLCKINCLFNPGFA